MAGAGTAEYASGIGPGLAVAELALGVLIGVAVGGAGGLVVKTARGRGWVADGFAGASVLALAGCAYACALALHGNGFIAAFTGGLAYGATKRPAGPAARAVRRGDRRSGFAAGVAGVRGGRGRPRAARPELAGRRVRGAQPDRDPVALALAGGGLGRGAVAFVGWFGPRGLASVVFALIALEDLGQSATGPAVTVITFTVLLSVLAHGVTADPLARRYGPALAPATAHADEADSRQLPERRLIRRAS